MTADTESSSAHGDDSYGPGANQSANTSSPIFERVDVPHPRKIQSSVQLLYPGTVKGACKDAEALGTYKLSVLYASIDFLLARFINEELQYYRDRPPFVLQDSSRREDFVNIVVDEEGKRTKDTVTIQARDLPGRKYRIYTTVIYGWHFLLQHRAGGNGGYQLLAWPGHGAVPEKVVAVPPPKNSSSNKPASSSPAQRPIVENGETTLRRRTRTREKQTARSTQPRHRQKSNTASDREYPAAQLASSSQVDTPRHDTALPIHPSSGTNIAPAGPSRAMHVAGNAFENNNINNNHHHNIDAASSQPPKIGPQMEIVIVSPNNYAEPLHI
ncbi:MAG: hypothetical protein LQ346_000973 [Caloplaca aetnensis]|nr:MAG: hypothetical protein LQ346_000973 [Caloplaca aetnensis]